MSKKLQGNGLWESSRMMLPEHKETIIQHRYEFGRRSRPTIDEQELNEYFTCLPNQWNGRNASHWICSIHLNAAN